MFFQETEINAFFYPFTVKEKKASSYITKDPGKMQKPSEDLAYERNMTDNQTSKSYGEKITGKQTGVETRLSDMFFLIGNSQDRNPCKKQRKISD